MSSDYDSGWHGWVGGNTSSAESQRGQRDRETGVYLPTPKSDSGGGMAGVEDASVEVGAEYAKDPDAAVKSWLRVLLAFTVLGGVLGFFVGNWLHDGGLWLSYAKFFFFFDGLLVTSWLLAATLMGRATKRGTLTLLFVGGSVAFMIWSYMLYPAIFIHIR